MSTDILTRAEAAAVLKVSTDTLRRWAVRRTGPRYSRTGPRKGRCRYSAESLRQWLERQTVTPGESR